jgi:hypothetical protein
LDKNVIQTMSLIQIPQSLTHKKLTKIDALLVSGEFVNVVCIASTVLKSIENSLHFKKNNTQILSQLPSNTLLAIKNIIIYWITNLPKKFIQLSVIKYPKSNIYCGFLNQYVN